MCTKQWQSSYNDLLDVLNVPKLETRRRSTRLSTLYNLKNNLILFPGELLQKQHAVSRHDREQLLVQPFARCHQHYNSFVPRTIREWNNLTSEEVQATSTSSTCCSSQPTQPAKLDVLYCVVLCTWCIVLLLNILGVTNLISLLAI